MQTLYWANLDNQELKMAHEPITIPPLSSIPVGERFAIPCTHLGDRADQRDLGLNYSDRQKITGKRAYVYVCTLEIARTILKRANKIAFSVTDCGNAEDGIRIIQLRSVPEGCSW